MSDSEQNYNANTFLGRLILMIPFGIEHAYIDFDSIFTHEACHDLQNIDGRLNPADHSGDSL